MRRSVRGIKFRLRADSTAGAAWELRQGGRRSLASAALGL